jgi:hypothetical protein
LELGSADVDESTADVQQQEQQQQQQQQQQQLQVGQTDMLQPPSGSKDSSSSSSDARQQTPLSIQLPVGQAEQLHKYLDHMLEVNKVMNLTGEAIVSTLIICCVVQYLPSKEGAVVLLSCSRPFGGKSKS